MRAKKGVKQEDVDEIFIPFDIAYLILFNHHTSIRLQIPPRLATFSFFLVISSKNLVFLAYFLTITASTNIEEKAFFRAIAWFYFWVAWVFSCFGKKFNRLRSNKDGREMRHFFLNFMVFACSENSLFASFFDTEMQRKLNLNMSARHARPKKRLKVAKAKFLQVVVSMSALLQAASCKKQFALLWSVASWMSKGCCQNFRFTS